MLIFHCRFWVKEISQLLKNQVHPHQLNNDIHTHVQYLGLIEESRNSHVTKVNFSGKQQSKSIVKLMAKESHKRVVSETTTLLFVC